VSLKVKTVLALALIIFAAIACIYRVALWDGLTQFYQLISNRESIRNFVGSFGSGAPFIFMGIQILQVIFAPVPGEATGFIGGYLFGAIKGFIYSSIALAIGSWINFAIGRFLGERYVRKMVPEAKFNKFDRTIKRQGIVVLFILFLFPGFPKDYLCLFLGLSTLPLKIFLIMASVGRMPGTFILSLQGAYLFERNYLLLGVITGACLVVALLAYRYRESLYQWVEKMNH
jgi:uncharacterized membrane protein YdjX (TVP38/TMEM64 family)